MDDFLKYRWGWETTWYGWRRVLWFAVALDFQCKCAYVMIFGFCISYGQQIDKTVLNTTTIGGSDGNDSQTQVR